MLHRLDETLEDRFARLNAETAIVDIFLGNEDTAGFQCPVDAGDHAGHVGHEGQAPARPDRVADRLRPVDIGQIALDGLDIGKAALTGTVFIMGYDMTWLGAAPGSGATMAGPNSPLDGLTRILDVALAAGTPPSSLILGLPFYSTAALMCVSAAIAASIPARQWTSDAKATRQPGQ